MRRIILGIILALGLAVPALGQTPWPLIAPTPPVSDSSDRIATTAWVNNFFALGIPLATGKIFIGSAGGIATQQTMSGDATLSASGVITVSQAAGNFNVIGNLTVGGSIIDGNGMLMTNIAAPATPSAGTTRVYIDSSTKVLTFKNDAGTVGNAVVPATAGANQFMTSISAAGVLGFAQPAFTNISGQNTLAQLPTIGANTVLGSIAGGTPIALTTTQHTTLCNQFTSGLSGCVPASGGGTTNFLRADGTFAAPAGSAITSITNSIGADVALNNTANFFVGPSVAQGNSGTWFASGQVTVIDTAGSANYIAQLSDGTTVIDSAVITTPSASLYMVFALSGVITNPAGNIRISVKDQSSTNGKIIFNASGNSKDSTVTALRIN